MSNYDLFIQTVETLRYSQGFYSRIGNQLDSMTADEKLNLENELNNLDVQFNDTLDVVMYLET